MLATNFSGASSSVFHWILFFQIIFPLNHLSKLFLIITSSSSMCPLMCDPRISYLSTQFPSCPTTKKPHQHCKGVSDIYGSTTMTYSNQSSTYFKETVCFDNMSTFPTHTMKRGYKDVWMKYRINRRTTWKREDKKKSLEWETTREYPGVIISSPLVLWLLTSHFPTLLPSYISLSYSLSHTHTHSLSLCVVWRVSGLWVNSLLSPRGNGEEKVEGLCLL